jgi:hypothetical protein
VKGAATLVNVTVPGLLNATIPVLVAPETISVATLPPSIKFSRIPPAPVSPVPPPPIPSKERIGDCFT